MTVLNSLCTHTRVIYSLVSYSWEGKCGYGPVAEQNRLNERAARGGSWTRLYVAYNAGERGKNEENGNGTISRAAEWGWGCYLDT